MEMLNVEFWEIALDIAVLTLCGITVLYIARGKRYRKKETAPFPSEKRIEKIVHKTFYDLIHQNGGKSFRPMTDSAPSTPAVDADRHFVVGGGRARRNRSTGLPHRFDNGSMVPVDGPDPGRQDVTSLKIYKFKESGMSVGKISERLEMPRCEVELIAKFRPHIADTTGFRDGQLRSNGRP